MKCFTFRIAVCFVIFAVGTRASSQVTNNILQRVFLIKYKQSAGTAFTIEVDNRQYLITAEHVTSGIKEKDVIQIFHEKRWKDIVVRPIKLSGPQDKIIVLVPPFQLSPARPIELTSEMTLSQQFYFLGFPLMLKQEVGDMNRGYPLPFVKSGICSAFIRPEGKDYTLIYVDAVNNPGFSGGPLVYRDPSTNQIRVVGAVLGYPPLREAVLNKDPATGSDLDTGLFINSNPGIMVAYSITPAINAIKKRPEGPEVKR